MKRVLITRPRAQADDFANALRQAGFEPVFFPVIKIQPIENNADLAAAVSNWVHYDWVIFTSANAVEIVFDRFARRLEGNLNKPRYAAVGPRTARVLQSYGVSPEFVPGEYMARAILQGLGDLFGKHVLLPRAEMAGRDLPEAIREAGGLPQEVVIYQTLPAQPDADGLAALRVGVDVITFTSSSAVQNFVEITQQLGLDPFTLPGNPTIACIGPVTEHSARDAGYLNVIRAKEYMEEGLVEAINHLHDS